MVNSYKKTVERLRAQLHPLISVVQLGRWRSSELDKTAANLEPAHVISITPTTYVVDGLVFEDAAWEDPCAKRFAAIKAIEKVYGKLHSAGLKTASHSGYTIKTMASDKKVLLPNVDRRLQFVLPLNFSKTKGLLLKVAYPTLIEVVGNPFGHDVYPPHNTDDCLLLLCFEKSFTRLAFLTEYVQIGHSPRDLACIPERVNDDVPLVIAQDDTNLSYMGRETYPLSNNFFSDPKPENATTFADLCVLAGAQSNWHVNSKIETPPRNKLDLASISLLISTVQLLQTAIGFNSLVNAAYVQLLLLDEKRDETVFWRVFLNYAELIRQGSFKNAEAEAVRTFINLMKRTP
jgi:hypothetical protein